MLQILLRIYSLYYWSRRQGLHIIILEAKVVQLGNKYQNDENLYQHEKNVVFLASSIDSSEQIINSYVLGRKGQIVCCRCLQQMFAKILQNNQLSSDQQKNVLKTIYQVNLKQNLPEVKLQLTHNYEQLKPILIKHYKYALKIAFAILNWQTSRDFVEGRRQGAVFDLIVTIAKEGGLNKEGQYIITQILKAGSDPWKCLVVLLLASQIICPRITNLQDYNWFLAGFIQQSAGIIQAYLAIKNEKTQSNQDRIQKDLILVNNCEEWVTNAYVKLLKNLKSPKNNLQKQSILSALSHIVGALYQSERQGHLNADLLHKIMASTSNYIFQSYKIDQIRNIFIARLKELKYNNPIKKVQIPAKYDEKTYIQTQGICWIIHRFLEQSKEIYSIQKQIDYSLLIYSEILPFPLKIKQTLTQRIHQLLSNSFHSAQFQINYPIALLLFNIYQHNRQEYESISQKLRFNQDKPTKLNRLKRLLSINIENLNVEKTQFVVTHLDEDSLSLKEALFLIKIVEFNFANQDLGNLVSNLFEKVSKCHGELGRKVVVQILERERSAKRNVELCHQLSKIYAK